MSSQGCSQLEGLFKGLRDRAEKERFVHKAVSTLIEGLAGAAAEGEAAKGEAIGSLSSPELVELLAEQVYLETLLEGCKEKIEAARRRHDTVKERFKQLVCDRYDLPDDEPIRVDVGRMQILRGDREARIEEVKAQVGPILNADEDALKEILEKEGKGTLEGDLAELFMGSHRETAIKLCQEVFQTTGQDREFLETLISDEDVPKPIRMLAGFVRKERGIACCKGKILDWL